ncbi:MAG TPA: hypothetical protein VG125_12195 [Pirellulales bacterium]|jgi:GNAT superfamily N-acetyltransferase|nr:hypothetical protein [Pirellulales bacterium]
MNRIPRDLQLDYLNEYGLGAITDVRRRKVVLRRGNLRNLADRQQHFRQDTFSWKLARQLEGRDDLDDGEGVWPINFWRCARRFGTPGSDLFPSAKPLSEASPETYSQAREMRLLCYHRAASALEARDLINGGCEVRYATEVTEHWYDPPNGTIVVPDEPVELLGSHGVPLLRVDNSDGQYFLFLNSWGGEWGFNGWGAISFDHFDRYIIEAWHAPGAGLFMPIAAKTGVVCLEWKWSLTDEIGVHGREVLDATTGDRLAWAFCKRRKQFLDIEEFYVWPSARGKGHGRALASMVTSLAAQMALPLRLLVSYADTEPANAGNPEIAARLLGLQLMESGERWVHLIGTASPVKVKRASPRPQRPAFLVERLRPRDERPIETPIEYSVFFGTNRRPVNHAGHVVAFDSERDHVLHTGITNVTIPRTHRFGNKGSY